MGPFDWIVAAALLTSMIYLSFVQTVGGWISALRKGQAVSLLPEGQGRKRPAWLQILFVLLGLAILLPLWYFLWIPLVPLPLRMARSLQAIGLVLYLAGFALVEWGRRTLGRYWGISTGAQVRLLDDHELIQGGPYAFVRHPMYFGAWVLFLGLTLIYPVWAILLLFLSTVIAFAGRARREEAALAERFGRQWVEYRRRTHYLIPFIY